MNLLNRGEKNIEKDICGVVMESLVNDDSWRNGHCVCFTVVSMCCGLRWLFGVDFVVCNGCGGCHRWNSQRDQMCRVWLF
ncbi:hypothetical protein VNO78_23434 [Psophocarpus tetragonolobus]|uniref:Uncharacterized protein n=1 Tax=Psophocarpus tetragonolobus TaxID=3891 RepID=A0AAN9S447_PSOTE